MHLIHGTWIPDETAIESGESLLIFTQYAEIGAALKEHLARTLRCTAYYLHGGTSVSRREKMIEDAFSGRGVSLLPGGKGDFTTSCSCPDWGDPCKHVAGLCYLLASELDRDPFLLFELRGLSREQLHGELVRSPLGQILASELTPREVRLEPVQSYYTRPAREPASATASLKEFWTGPRRLPPPIEPSGRPTVPALSIKKQGDYPPFWKKDASFVEVMEALYERVRTKSPEMR